MIDQLYLASVDTTAEQVIERRAIQEHEKGLIHSKQAFRYEVVKTLPKEADSFNKAFDYAQPFGTLRMAWIDSDIINGDSTATALGGSFGFNTASFYGFKLHVGATTSQKVPLLNPSQTSLNPDFYDEIGDSFTYLSEASIDYESEELFARLGRIRIDTPYADSDDIRMAANTFEGFWANYVVADDFIVQTYYLSQWAGYDSGDSQDLFKPLYITQEGEEGWGALGASLSVAFNTDDEASLWYYHIDKMSDIAYGEVAGHFTMTEQHHIEYGIQASYIQEIDQSHIEGQVIGAMAIIDYENFFFGLAGNYAFVDEYKSITDGFGGGPYYTSLDESTIGFVSEQSPGVDVLSTRIGVGADLEMIGIEGLTVELVHGQIKSTDDSEWFKENDMALTYIPDDRIEVSAVFANFYVQESKDRLENDHFNRFVVRADYKF
ncbi:MAG: porin [Campylobacterota bacterium]|nr:porin [Campylobacterota bacterium]